MNPNSLLVTHKGQENHNAHVNNVHIIVEELKKIGRYERKFKEAAIMKVQIQKSHPSEKIEDPSENFEKIYDTHI